MAGRELTWDEAYHPQPRGEWSGKACFVCGKDIPDWRGLDRYGKPIPASECLPCILIRRPGELRELRDQRRA